MDSFHGNMICLQNKKIYLNFDVLMKWKDSMEKAHVDVGLTYFDLELCEYLNEKILTSFVEKPTLVEMALISVNEDHDDDNFMDHQYVSKEFHETQLWIAMFVSVATTFVTMITIFQYM